MIPTNLSVPVKKKNRRNNLAAKQEANLVNKIAAIPHNKVKELVKELAMLVEAIPIERAKIETTEGTTGIDPIMVNPIPTNPIRATTATAPIRATIALVPARVNPIRATTATARLLVNPILVLKDKIVGLKPKVEHH